MASRTGAVEGETRAAGRVPPVNLEDLSRWLRERLDALGPASPAGRVAVAEAASIRPPSPAIYLVIPVQPPGALRHRYCVGARLPGQHFAGSPTLSRPRAD
jgi:hypothetical protein